MHTARMLAAGFALLGVLLLLAPRVYAGALHPIAAAVRVFLPVWLVASLVNAAIGVHRAGYGLGLELAVLPVVFGVPAGAALLLRWRFGRGPA